MATYTGVALTINESLARQSVFPYSESSLIRTSPIRFTSSKVYEDTYSRELYPGEYQSIWYGCDAGDVTISVYVWNPTNGKAGIEVYDPDTGERIDSSYASGSGSWEQVSVSFTASKKLYIIRLVNNTKAAGDKRAYFDKLE